MQKGFIFDFDGVICDSEKFHHLAWQQTAATLGLSFSREEYVPFQSTGRRVVITYLLQKANIPFTEERFSALSAVKSAAFARLTEHVGANDLIKGADKFILRLYEEGYPLAVASSASSAKKMLSALGLSRYFAVQLDGTDALPKKPDPTVFLTAARLLGLSPKEITVFEDSAAGVLAAQNGGFSVVGIGDTLSPSSFPICKDFTEVYSLFFR